MKQIAYFLISLTLTSQFNDIILSAASNSQIVPIPTDDDDEFIASERQEEPVLFALRRQPQAVSVKPYVADISFAGRGLPSRGNLAAPFIPPPLSLFMSLQI